MNLGVLTFIAALAQGGFIPNIPAQYHPIVPSPNDIVARVNGQPIYAKDVEPYLWEWRGPEATEELISLALVQSAAKKAGIEATPPEIELRLEQDIQTEADQKKKDPNDHYPNLSAQQTLEAQGFPMSRLYLRAELEVLIDDLSLKGFQPGDFVKVSTMVFPEKDATAPSVSVAENQATIAYKSLKKGVGWVSVLRTTNPSQTELASSGMLGWRRISIFPAVLQTALKTGKTGDVTLPVQTPNGFQIFKIDAFGATASGADLKELKTGYAQANQQQIVANLQQNSKVERFPAKEPGNNNPVGNSGSSGSGK